MKAPAPALMLAVPLGIGSALVVPMTTWVDLRTAVLPALSVIGAAVLVRLARGFPFTNADHFTLPEFRRTADKLRDIAHKLRTMMIVCLAAMGQIIIYPSLLAFVARQPLPGLLVGTMEAFMSGALAAATVYAFVRIIEVIQIDVALLKLQARLLENVIAAKNAKAFEKELEAQPPGKIAGAETYGRQLQ